MKTETRKSPPTLTGYARLKDTLQMQGASLTDLVQYLEEHKAYLSSDHKQKLSDLACVDGIGFAGIQPVVTMQAGTLDLREQVHTLWSAVMIILNSEIDFSTGVLKNPDTRNASDALSKATSLASLLSKLYEDVVTQSRMQQIEHAVVETVRAHPGMEETFLALLNKNLESVE